MKLHSEVRAKIRSGQPVLHAMLRLANPAIAEIMANSGIEMICIDNEHYAFTDEDVIDIARAAQGAGAECIVRVNSKDFHTMYRVMDMGVNGILAPQVESYEEARKVVDAVKYAPVGKRGCCPITRGALYGQQADPVTYYQTANENTIVGLMIETKRGIEDLDRILTIPEIDFIAVGPSDVSGSFGKPGQADDPEVKEAIETAFRKIRQAGIAACGMSYTANAARESVEAGRMVLNLGSDVQMLTAMFGSHIEGARKVAERQGTVPLSANVKEKMRNKEIVIAPMVRIANPAIGEIAASAGADMLVVDDEHFAFSDKELIAMIRAVQSCGVPCVVRVYDKSRGAIYRIMDMGADGVIAPQVKNYEEAIEIVRAVKYPPEGDRGMCPITRGANYGYGMEPRDYVKAANQRTIVGLMIETKSAIGDLDRILTIPELDYLSVGPSDVSASYGYPGQYDHPAVQEALQRAWETIKKSHCALAGQAYSDRAAAEAVEAGKTNLNIGSDLQYLVWGFNEHVADVREAIRTIES